MCRAQAKMRVWMRMSRRGANNKVEPALRACILPVFELLLGFRARYHGCNRLFLLLSRNGSCTAFLGLLSFWAVDGLWGSVRLLVCSVFFGQLRTEHWKIGNNGFARCHWICSGRYTWVTKVSHVEYRKRVYTNLRFG